MVRRQKRGFLPLIALLFFVNGALCYCFDFGHDHAHGYNQESDEPAPHDCECTTLVDYLQPDSEHGIDIQGLTALVRPAAEPVEVADTSDQRALTEVRPPGERAPPKFVLHCALLC